MTRPPLTLFLLAAPLLMAQSPAPPAQAPIEDVVIRAQG